MKHFDFVKCTLSHWKIFQLDDFQVAFLPTCFSIQFKLQLLVVVVPCCSECWHLCFPLTQQTLPGNLSVAWKASPDYGMGRPARWFCVSQWLGRTIQFRLIPWQILNIQETCLSPSHWEGNSTWYYISVLGGFPCSLISSHSFIHP